jgi:6-phosphofructokinase 1
MIEGDIEKLQSYSVSNIIQRWYHIKICSQYGFRTPRQKEAYDQLQEHGIEGIIAIGGMAPSLNKSIL